MVDQAHFFDKRFLEWDGDSDQATTRDKRFIWVDTYARWRIADPQALSGVACADERNSPDPTRRHHRRGHQDGLLPGMNLVELVRSTNRTVTPDPSLPESEMTELQTIDRDRAERDHGRNSGHLGHGYQGSWHRSG